MQRTLLLLFGFFLSLIFLQAQKPVQALYETRGSDTGPWNNAGLLEYTYTPADSLETALLHSVDPLTGMFQPQGKDTYTFDSQNRKTSWTYSSMQQNNWVDLHRELYTYNANGLVSNMYYQSYIAGSWSEGLRHDYQYDQNQQKVYTRKYTYTAGNWMENASEFFIYDGAGNLIKRVDTYTDTLGNIIDSSFRESYTYTLQNKIQTRLIESKSSGGWTAYEKYEYSYTPGDILSMVRKQADLNSDLILEDEYTIHYTYNANGSLHQETRVYSTDSPVGGEQRLTYFYNLSNEEEAPEKVLTVYPNPATELVQVDGITGNATLLLSDLYGRTFQFSLQNGRADVSTLAAGMYIVRIQQKEQSYNGGKLIIAR